MLICLVHGHQMGMYVGHPYVCHIETPNVVGVGVRETMGSAGGGSAPPTPCMYGYAGWILISFGEVSCLYNMSSGMVRRKELSPWGEDVSMNSKVK